MSQLPASSYARINKRLKITIALLSLLLAISAYLLYRKEALVYSVAHKPSFIDPVDPPLAEKMVVNYRSTPSFPVTTKRSYGVFYTSDEISHYLGHTFKDFVDKNPAPAKQSWVIGFYFMKKIDAVTHKRMDFLVFPQLYDSASKSVYDWYDDRDKYPELLQKFFSDNPTGYDAGHLWP